MLESRRVRTLAAAGALAVALSLGAGSAGPVAEAAPRTFTILGGGYGHGIGMSQYGAQGMAMRGASAGRIISFYYGGAKARPAALPGTIRVGLLQADHDPSAGGRLGRVLVRGAQVPGRGGSGRFAVSGVTRGGRTVRRGLSGNTTWAIRPDPGGGASVFSPSGRRVFGPTRAGHGVVVRYQTYVPPARLLLPQTGQELRWGHLEVHLVRDNRGVSRPRAVAVLPFNGYLRGLGEVPGSFATHALRAQAIAARSYALYAVQARTQHWGYRRWDGCNCALYGTVRDQHFAGYAKEQGYYGARWVAAVRGTGSQVVRYGSRLVQAFYSSSSGGYTSSNAQWGSAPLPWFPGRPDPYDRGGGDHRNPNFRWTKTISAAGLGARLGIGTATRVRQTNLPSWGGRVSRVTVEGVNAGRRTSVTVIGTWFRQAYGLKSTKFRVSPWPKALQIGPPAADVHPEHRRICWRTLVLFRSLRSLAGRALAAGAASALTLTLFNAAQPTLGNHQVQPGTLRVVKVTLTPVAPGPPAARVAGPGSGAGSGTGTETGLWTTPRFPFRAC